MSNLHHILEQKKAAVARRSSQPLPPLVGSAVAPVAGKFCCPDQIFAGCNAHANQPILPEPTTVRTAASADWLTLSRPMAQRNPFSLGSSTVGRPLSTYADVELERALQPTGGLSQIQQERALTARMSLLADSSPLGLSSPFTVAARKRSIELAVDRELRNQEILVQAAKRRRLERQSLAIHQEQFVQSQKILPDTTNPLLLPPPAAPSLSSSMLTMIRGEHTLASAIPTSLASRSSSAFGLATLQSFSSLSLPGSRRTSNRSLASVASAPPSLSPSAKKAPVLLCLSCDQDNLTDYQQLARQQIQLFEADQRDAKTSTKGRNRRIEIGQVGIQCRHCAHVPPGERAKGSTIYPSKLEGIYQAAQNMANGHIAKHCQHVPKELKSQLLCLGNRKSTAGGGRDYWSKGAKILGVVEDDHGLRFGSSSYNM